MKHNNKSRLLSVLISALIAAFSAQVHAQQAPTASPTTYVYRKNIPGVREQLAALEARTNPFIDHYLPLGGDTAGGNVMAVFATQDGLNPLYGHGFSMGTTVSIDGVAAAFSLQGVTNPGMAGSLNVVMPAHSIGSANVVIHDPKGVDVSATYNYSHSVSVSQVTPHLTLNIGDQLAIYGTGFVPGSVVSVDGTTASSSYVSSTQLWAYAPTHTPGTATLTVTNPDTSTFAFSGLTYGSPAAANFTTTLFNAGQVYTGLTGTPATATVSNPGDSPVTYSAITGIPSWWSLGTSTGACSLGGGTIAPHGSCTLTFTYAPTDVSQAGALVSFTPTTAGIAATTLSLQGSASKPNTYATLNPVDMAGGMALSNGNLTATNIGTGDYLAARATQGLTTGKWYWEAYNENNTNLLIGVMPGTTNISLAGTYGYGWLGNGFYFYTNPTSGTSARYDNPISGSYPWAYPSTNVLGIALDMDAHQITYYVNGVSAGIAPVALPAGPLYPSVRMYSTSTITVNFGATSFKYPVPAGYHAGVYQ